MKKVYYKSKIAYFGQIFIWIFLAIIFISLFLLLNDYSKDSIKVFLISFIIVESIASLSAFGTMRKIVFWKDYISVKIGFLQIKKLSYCDVKHIGIIKKMSGPQVISCVYFSKQFFNKEQIEKLFDKQSIMNKEDIIFCEYPQSDLKLFLKKTFPKIICINNSEDI